ncbi:hypothetical protein [Actinotalea solisilvae]|uniref:hypothetical protein n=1 Tax=Actinotalea solisilvae TaxID=2072922 RepID=UPI0018F262A6|nr:hypothetical protein [Actinotalea solisilvae]
MRRPAGYRLRDMTLIGKLSLAVGALALAGLILQSAVTDEGAWWGLLVVASVGVVVGFISEVRRLARQGLPFTWR